jgi:hypothetical protein
MKNHTYRLVLGLLVVGGCQRVLGLNPGEPLPVVNDGSGGTGGSGGGMSSSSSGGMGGTDGGMGTECAVPGDCFSNECRTATGCSNGYCLWQYAPENVKANSQLYGDCKDRVCDGNGDFKNIDGDLTKDRYAFGNVCYLTDCDANLNPMPNNGATCTTPWGNPAGKCDAFKCIDCVMDADCTTTNTCRNGRCVAATCVDSIEMMPESDLDCGGPDCLKCAEGKECIAVADCEGVCDTSVMPFLCLAATCADMLQNQDETDVDCGGSCATGGKTMKCDAGKKCLLPADCVSGVCKDGVCEVASCTDFTMNDIEEGIDCGGTCSPCPTP